MKRILKNKAVLIVLGIIIFLVLGVIGGSGIQRAKEKKQFESHIASAEKYLSELDYEQAIAEYTAALEIEPNEQAVKDALVEAYLEYAQMYVSEGEYEEAINLLKEGNRLLESDMLLKQQEEIAIIPNVLKMIYDDFESGNISEVVKKFNDNFGRISKFCDTEKDNDEAAPESKQNGIVFIGENGRGIKVEYRMGEREEGIHLYYGELIKTMRKGQGVDLRLLHRDKWNLISVYVGEWNNNLPDGMGYYFNGGNAYIGQYKEGLCNGNIDEAYNEEGYISGNEIKNCELDMEKINVLEIDDEEENWSLLKIKMGEGIPFAERDIDKLPDEIQESIEWEIEHGLTQVKNGYIYSDDGLAIASICLNNRAEQSFKYVHNMPGKYVKYGVDGFFENPYYEITP